MPEEAPVMRMDLEWKKEFGMADIVTKYRSKEVSK